MKGERVTIEELKHLKKVELDILLMFDQYCNKYSLQYYLIGGALLGAARYGGFIPWDDDIDVAMPREDYEKLKQIWRNDGKDGYFLQHEGSDPNFARCIMKLRKNDTEIIEKTTAGIHMHHGIYIDIFPIDYVSDNCEKKLARRAKSIRHLMTLCAIKSGYKGNYQGLKKIIRGCIFWWSKAAIEKRIYNLCVKENQGTRAYSILYLHNYSWEKQIHKSEVFGMGVKCMFEGGEFFAPTDTDAFLNKVFGIDYMQDPPEEKRRNPHKYLSVRFE